MGRGLAVVIVTILITTALPLILPGLMGRRGRLL